MIKLDLKDATKRLNCMTGGNPFGFVVPSGMPDSVAIKCFKNNGDVIVIDKKGQKWRKREKYET